MTSTGIETASGPGREANPSGGEAISRVVSLPGQHLLLTQVVLFDQTDGRNELVQERQWLLHPSERNLALRGNLFVVEDMADGTGHVFVKKAPLPDSRPVRAECDLRVTFGKTGGFDFALVAGVGDDGDSWEVLEYGGGDFGRARVLQEWQRGLRPATAGHATPRFLSNTWGDRSRDSRMQEAFIAQEIEAGHRLGVEMVQLDDGWQRGMTSNSAYAAKGGGVWEGFWNADADFWNPHQERFPQGLGPLAEQARARGMNLGLWFAPDSWNEFANWRRDADCILEKFHTLGVEHFKVDSINAKTTLASANLKQFLKAVIDGSGGRVVFDIDITAGARPGYFGEMAAGPLFVENRYTDWHNYWPHQTLRNLWMLSRWVDPRRLRMEFLNHTRNVDKYPGDPLAPACYAPDALFATVMFSNPLGWFEVSNLPAEYFESVAPLVRVWKEHRDALFGGTIIPIGAEPDGFAPTGFLSISEARDCGYVVVFRELFPDERISIELPELGAGEYTWELLASGGGIESRGNILCATIPEPLGFLFARFTRG